MLSSIEECIVINGMNYCQIASVWHTGSEKDVNVPKTVKQKQYISGVKKLSQEFDIIKIIDSLRVSNMIQELVLSK